MKDKNKYDGMISGFISASGLEVPKDLIPWSYRWRCYIYSNILPAVYQVNHLRELDVALVIYLFNSLRNEHSCNWVRKSMYPLVDGTVSKIAPTPGEYTFKELSVILFFNRSIENKDYVVDDYMLINLPLLNSLVLGETNLPEEEVVVKNNYVPKYKLTPKFDFWEPDHYVEFERLAKIYKDKKDVRFLEIGSFEGRTSTWLLDNVLTGEGSKLTCVDVNPTDNLEHNLSKHTDKAIIIKTFSHIFLKSNEISYDFIYIDGDHNAPGVLEDAILSWRSLKVGGIMYFDDYEMKIKDPWFYIMHKEFKDNPRLSFIHPHVAVDAFLNIYRGQYEILFKNYLVGIKKLVDMGGENIHHGDDTQAALILE